jgi:hypothetical protein
MISDSGYGNGIGQDPASNQWLVPVGNNTKKSTALQKYGFNIPTPTYNGERPLIAIDINGILLPDNPVDGAVKFVSGVFGGSITDAPNDGDYDSLTYLSPHDYSTVNKTFEAWIAKDWDKAMSKISDGQCLLSSASKGDCKDDSGQVWVKKTLIDDNHIGANSGKNAGQIADQLKALSGKNYQDVCKNIILASGSKSSNFGTERMMPYDKDRMNSTDAKMFSVSDPRSDMQQNLFGTGKLNQIKTYLYSFVLSISSFFAEATVSLNSVGNFSFLDYSGINPSLLWITNIIQFLVTIIMCGFIIYIIWHTFKFVTGHNSAGIVLKKVLTAFVLCIIIASIAFNPGKSWSFTRQMMTTGMNLTNTAMSSDKQISSLYGNGTADEKESVSLWLPYFNMWTKYQTNHSITDSQENVNLKDGKPETQDMKTVKVGGKDQTLWSAYLADAFTADNKVYSGDIYRVVDHFMAPRVSVKLDENNKSFTVDANKNENYNGNIQSTIDPMLSFTQLLLLFIVFIKVLLFWEFIINFMLLIIRLALSIDKIGNTSKVFKEFGASMVNVLVINAIVTLIVFTCLEASGMALFVITLFYTFLVYSIIKNLYTSSSVFKPKFLGLFKSGMQTVGRMTS